MHFMHVGSIATYKEISRFSSNQMIQAPLANANSEYHDFYRGLSETQYTILDSGAFEVALKTERNEILDREFIDIGLSIRAHELVCLDAPLEEGASQLRSLSFIRLWRQIPLHIRPQLMVVPHGKTVREWFSNAESLIKAAGKCTVGIPRILGQRSACPRVDLRVRVAETLKSRAPDIMVHFLGAGPNILDELGLLRRYPRLVRSLDCTLLLRHATSGVSPLVSYSPPVVLNSTHTPINLQTRVAELASFFSWTNNMTESSHVTNG